MKKLILAAALLPNLVAANPTFTDVSEGLVPHSYDGGWEHFVGGGVAIMDCNGDTRPDLFAAGGNNRARLMINAGDFQFDDGGAFETGVTGAYPLDIDGDGNVDLAVLRVGENRLLKGDGTCGFTDASDAWGFESRDLWTTAFTALWEGDRPTLVFGNYVDRADPDGPFGTCSPHSVYRPTADGYHRTEIGPGFCTLSMLASDWQRDGTAQLRISNDRHYHKDAGFEQMFDFATLAQTPDWPIQKLWGMGIASGDITGDGKPEVMLSSMADQVLKINTGTGFVDAPYEIGTAAQRPYFGDDLRPSTGWHTEFADVDNDGDLDLFIAKGNVDAMEMAAAKDPNNLLIQQANGTFVEAGLTAKVGSVAKSRGAGLVDMNGDGKLDLVVVNRGAAMELYRNDTKDAGNWLSVQITGTDSNLFGIGTWIEVRSAGKTLAREVTIGGGHASGQRLPTHFGLGSATAAEVRLISPSGDTTSWTSVDVNTVVDMRP